MPSDGSAYSFWSALPGGVVGSILTLAVREWLDSRRAPRLSVEVAPGAPFSVAVARGSIDGLESAQFLRIKVFNAGQRTAKNCRVFMTRAQRPQAGKRGFDSLSLGVPVPLRWAGFDNVSSIDLPPGVPHFVDVAWTESSDALGDDIYLRWAAAVLLNADFEPLSWYPSDLLGSEFSVKLVVAAEGCKSVQLASDFFWDGSWNSLNWKAAARGK